MAKRNHLNKITDRLLNAHESIDDLRGVGGSEGLLDAINNITDMSDRSAKVERIKSKLSELESVLGQVSKLRPYMPMEPQLEVMDNITKFQHIRDNFKKTNRISISEIEKLNDIYSKAKEIYVKYKRYR